MRDILDLIHRRRYPYTGERANQDGGEYIFQRYY